MVKNVNFLAKGKDGVQGNILEQFLRRIVFKQSNLISTTKHVLKKATRFMKHKEFFFFLLSLFNQKERVRYNDLSVLRTEQSLPFCWNDMMEDVHLLAD